MVSEKEVQLRANTVYHFEDWRLNARARALNSPTGAHLEFTTGEFDLLVAFVEHPNRVLSRDQLLDLARMRDSLPVDRAIYVQVMRLRRKLEAQPEISKIIKTVRNGGDNFTLSVQCSIHEYAA